MLDGIAQSNGFSFKESKKSNADIFYCVLFCVVIRFSDITRKNKEKTLICPITMSQVAKSNGIAIAGKRNTFATGKKWRIFEVPQSE